MTLPTRHAYLMYGRQVLFARQHLVAFALRRIDDAAMHEHPLPPLLAHFKRVMPRLPRGERQARSLSQSWPSPLEGAYYNGRTQCSRRGRTEKLERQCSSIRSRLKRVPRSTSTTTLSTPAADIQKDRTL